ncbi:MAG: hypothetical protein WD396_10375, partial [Pseudohongiellaceae bacterium]
LGERKYLLCEPINSADEPNFHARAYPTLKMERPNPPREDNNERSERRDARSDVAVVVKRFLSDYPVVNSTSVFKQFMRKAMPDRPGSEKSGVNSPHIMKDALSERRDARRAAKRSASRPITRRTTLLRPGLAGVGLKIQG